MADAKRVPLGRHRVMIELDDDLRYELGGGDRIYVAELGSVEIERVTRGERTSIIVRRADGQRPDDEGPAIYWEPQHVAMRELRGAANACRCVHAVELHAGPADATICGISLTSAERPITPNPRPYWRATNWPEFGDDGECPRCSACLEVAPMPSPRGGPGHP